MDWPQWAIIIVYAVSVLAIVSMHGKQRQGTHDGVSTIIVVAAYLWVLWMGNFFN